MKKFIRYLIVLSLLVVTAGICSAKPTPRVPFTHDIIVQENCPNGGMTDLVLQVKSYKLGRTPEFEGHYMKELKPASIHFSDNITYRGETDFVFDLIKDTVVEISITVDIPRNDTSWVMFRYQKKYDEYKYFITTKNTVEIKDNSPEYHRMMIQGGPGAYMHNPDLPQPPYKEHSHSVHTGSKQFSRHYTKEEIQIRKMQRLEEKPLIGHSSQDIVIEGELYRRYEGEKKFQKIEPIKEDSRTIEERIQAAEDSVKAIPEDSLFRACLWIDTDAQLKIVTELHGEQLQVTSNPRYYHIVCTRSELKTLYDKHLIKLNFTKDFDHVHPDSTGERQQPIPNFRLENKIDNSTTSKKKP